MLEFLQTLFGTSPVHAEYRFIFTRESISEAVFQDTAGTDYIGILSVVLYDPEELVPHGIREGTAHDLIGEVSGQAEISFFRSLLNPHLPEIIVHDIGIIEVRPYIEGIMWFQDFADVRFPVADDRSGQQHAAGFTADHAGPDHVVPYGKIILGRKMLFDHFTHLRIPGHHDIAHLITVLCDIHAAVAQQSGPAEEFIPGIGILLLCRPLGLAQGKIETAGLHAVQNRPEMSVFGIVDMGQEHGVGIPVPYLFRTDINILFVRVDIKEKLGGIQDLVDGLHGMPASDDRKEGDGIQDKEEGACDSEEIPHHKVRGPGRLQFRKTVKYIESVIAFLFNYVMYGDRKVLKSVGQGNINPFDLRALLYKGFMAGKPEIDNIPAVGDSLPDIRLHEQLKVGQFRHTPYHVVTQPDVVQGLVHFRYTALDSVKCCHMTTS